MSATYPTPATPLPWTEFKPRNTVYGKHGEPVTSCHYAADMAYIVHAANAFPHLVAALEAMLRDDHFGLASSGARHALAIARGEVAP